MITIPSNSRPSDYGLPYREWRPNQRDMLSKALSIQQDDILVIEAPTGTGKSAVVAALAKERPTVGMVATRDLQQQYANSFPALQIVWGRQHYKCVLPSWMESWRRRYGEDATRDDCPYQNKHQCAVVEMCPYEVAKQNAATAGRLVTNYAYGFYTDWWHRVVEGDECSPLGVVVCDEAHRLPEVLSGLVSLSVSGRVVRKYSLPPLPLLAGSSAFALREAARWLSQAKDALAAVVARVSNSLEAERSHVRLAQTYNSVRMLHSVIAEAAPDTWYVSSGMAIDRFEIRPVVLGSNIVERIIPTGVPAILMSATIGAPDMLMIELGIRRPYSFTGYPHIFRQEMRPVFYYKSAPRISNNSTEHEYSKQLDIISKIVKNHTGQRGVIHTTSWKHAKILADGLSHQFGDRVFVPTGERVAAVSKFVAHGPDTVAISPSWSEGLDFHDDLARFCIVAKIPFPYLGDPVVSLKLKQLGRKWYDWQATLGVVQAVGRIVRHEKDWGVSYIVDGFWPRVARLAPSWFEVQAI